MKELDVLLSRWLEQSYGVATSAQKNAFAEFLELPDPEIARYLLGHEIPEDCERRELVTALRETRAIASPGHRS